MIEQPYTPYCDSGQSRERNGNHEEHYKSHPDVIEEPNKQNGRNHP